EQLSALISGAAGAGTKDRATAATAAAHAGLADPATTDPITVGDDPVAILDAFTARNWADGLPIIAPTEERVSAMLGGRDGARSLGVMPPLWRQVTLEKLAVNAVMAGCEPRAFPVVAAAVDAMLDRAFNLYGVQATTHPVAPLLVVNGPYGLELGLHGGSGCFGPGFRANATIGRGDPPHALRPRRLPRLERRLVFRPEPAARGARARARAHDRGGRLRARGRAAIRLRARAPAARPPQAGRHVGHA